VFDGERVSLQAPQGIFKPRVCRFPLSIATVPTKEDGSRPYDDAIGDDGLLRYRYRGTNPSHVDNVGLREAMRQRVPLIYFHGIVEGKYEAEYPVFIVGDSPEALTFTVTVDERRFVSLGSVPDESIETDIRRRYVTRTVQQRLHQQEFRERVLEAYRRHCAICRLRHDQLLEAAHIIGDREAIGTPTVPNGIALCSLHHAAFDAHLMTVRPDYQIEVRRDVLEESDGPMLIHGLQGFHEKSIRVPSRLHLRPDPQLLEIRYDVFLRKARTS
jgi:putative restriction endonuclease